MSKFVHIGLKFDITERHWYGKSELRILFHKSKIGYELMFSQSNFSEDNSR